MTALSEAQAMVTTLSAAYTKCLNGRLKQKIRTGGTDHFTEVSYVLPTANDLLIHLEKWQAIVATLQREVSNGSKLNNFTQGNSIPLLVRRNF